MVEFTANKPQLAALSLKSKFKGFIGGYGSGKTFVGCADQCRHFYEHPWVPQGYFAPTYPQIRDIYYPTIEEVAYMFGFKVDIKEGNHEVHFKRGQYYYGVVKCRSMENPKSIVGFKIGNALVDEIDLLPLAKALVAWRKIIGRLRFKELGVENGAFIATTPEGFNFAYKVFVSDIKLNPALARLYQMIQASTRENFQFLPDDYIESLLLTYPDELVDAYIDGKFVNLTTGTVYKSFSRTRHDSKMTIIPGEILHIGMDFNVGKMAAKVFVTRRLTGWHCVAELYDIFDTPAMIDAIEERWGKDHIGNILVYPDATGKNRKSLDASTSDLALLEEAGFAVRVDNGNPRVRDSILSVNKRFEVNQLWVNVDECPRTADDLEQQAYNEKGEPDKKSGRDHGNDAFRYPITYTFPIRKPLLRAPVVFG